MIREKINKTREFILFVLMAIINILPNIYNSCSEAFFLFFSCGLLVTILLTSLVMLLPYRVLRWLFFTILFVVSLFEIAHELIYDGDIASAGFIRSLFMTTPYEAEGAVGRIVKQHLIFIFCLLLSYICVSVLIFTTYPQQRIYMTSIVFSAVILIIISELSGVVMIGGGACKSILYNPPINVYMQIAEAFRQGRQRDYETAKSIERNCDDQIIEHQYKKQIVLLVIDESLCYDRLSINNFYERATTPRLERIMKDGQLVSFSNYYASGVFTMYSVPMLITQATAQNFECNYSTPAIQEFFRCHGYESFWISNEAQIINDGESDYLARGAQIINVQRDIDMPRVVDSICGLYEKVFSVLHLWGSHQFYMNTMSSTSRYFPDVTTSDCVRGNVIYENSYDNTILYTDSLLASLIEMLDKQRCLTTILFTSDHGEGPITLTGGAHGYTNPHTSEYHVPLMVWYSDEYKNAYPRKVANVIKHKDEPVCADHVFWSVLDMADIQIGSTLQQKGMSIFGDTLLPHQRTLLLPDGKSVMTLD